MRNECIIYIFSLKSFFYLHSSHVFLVCTVCLLQGHLHFEYFTALKKVLNTLKLKKNQNPDALG